MNSQLLSTPSITFNINSNITFKDLKIIRSLTATGTLFSLTTGSQSKSIHFINVSFLKHDTYLPVSSTFTIDVFNSTTYFENCHFKNIEGWATVNLVDSPTTFIGSIFINSNVPITAKSDYNRFYQVSINNCVFNGSQQADPYVAGAIQPHNVAFKISNSQFYNNSGLLGGAIYFNTIDLSSQPKLEIISCKFDNNKAQVRVIYIYS